MSRQLLFLQRRIKYREGGDSLSHTQRHTNHLKASSVTCVRGDKGTSTRPEKLPVWKEKWDWRSDGDVILLEREGGRKGEGWTPLSRSLRENSLGYFTSSASSSGISFFFFYSFYRLSTWFKDGGLILYRVDDCFSVFSSLWRWVFRVKCWPQSCARSLLWNT